jgi:hypothetical protein
MGGLYGMAKGTCCSVCRGPIVEGEKVHVTGEGPLTLTHLRCLDATSP